MMSACYSGLVTESAGIANPLCSDDLKPGDCEMVVDGGRALQPCRYRLFTHMSCNDSMYGFARSSAKSVFDLQTKQSSIHYS